MVAFGPDVTVCCGADTVDVGIEAELVVVDVFSWPDPQAGKARTNRRRTAPAIAFDNGMWRNERVGAARAFCG